MKRINIGPTKASDYFGARDPNQHTIPEPPESGKRF
jgi:hypothetical protein